MFNKACWIWKNDVEEYINDKKVSFGQYPNYPSI